MSMNFTLPPAVVNRSVMPGVGSPPDQTIASIVPDFMPSTVLGRSSRCGCTSVSGFRPAACSTRWAMTSVPDFGEPVETRLPLMSATELMPASARTTTCVKLS